MKFTDEYDDYFRIFSEAYFGEKFDWRWFKAQGAAETKLDPDHESRKGHHGIMQLNTAAWKRDIAPHLNVSVARGEEPYISIFGAVYLNRCLWNGWSKIADENERLRFVFASKYAGYDIILRAYVKSRDKKFWEFTQKKLWYIINDRNVAEVKAYMTRLEKYYEIMRDE